MVIVYHVTGGAMGDDHLMAAGVDIFFVISGFVMVSSTAGRGLGFKDFMVARAVRIVPPYWIALFGMALLLGLRDGSWPGIAELLKAYFFVPYTNMRNGLPCPFLVPGWTLNYEMFFYLLFGATLVLGTKRQLITLAALFAFFVLLRPVIGHLGAAPLRITSPLLFEFLGGAVLAANLKLLQDALKKWNQQVIGLALVALGIALALTANLLGLHLPRTVGWGGPAFIIVTGVVLAENLFRGKAFAPLMLLGNASYSIYLFHSFALELLTGHIDSGSITANRAILLILAIGFGYLCYVTIERPLLTVSRKLVRRLLPERAVPRVATDSIQLETAEANAALNNG